MRFFAILFAFTFAPLGSFGQIIPTLETPLEIVSIPQVPAPGETVTLRADTTLEKNRVTYVWTINGEVALQGIGANEITLTAGSIGTRTAVLVRVQSNGEVIGSKNYTLIPGELDLLWEGNTYVPPFYIGKPLPTGDSLITISAIPSAIVNGSKVNADAMVYEWYVNNAQTPKRSGFGLSSITLSPPLFDSPFNVRVVATTPDGSFLLQERIVITPGLPEVELYQKHPLLGVLFNRVATEGFMLSEEEVTLRLFPFFVTNIFNATYTWEANGREVNTEEAPRELTLRKTGDGVGRANINAKLEVEGSLYEKAERSVLITF